MGLKIFYGLGNGLMPVGNEGKPKNLKLIKLQ
jgi:hypothetical protein